VNNQAINRTVGSLAIIGLATILTAIVASTIKWVDPFLSNDSSGTPTIIGRLFVYGIYAVEGLAGLVVLGLACMALWSFIPKKQKARKSNQSKLDRQTLQIINGKYPTAY
jgi:cellobiose-specific phosphotransferase system component IIC